MAVLACNYVIAQQKVYCEIVGTQKFAKSQVTVGIDLGKRMPCAPMRWVVWPHEISS